MDCHSLDAAKICINALDSKFPDSMRVGRLEGMWYEAKGSWQKAEKVYSNLLTEDPSDTVVHKRSAMAKAQGNMVAAVEGLNKYT
jgi:predicted Zn-dependent protease